MKEGSGKVEKSANIGIVTERPATPFLAILADCLLIGCAIYVGVCRFMQFMQDYARNMQKYAQKCDA